jgi:dimethylamine monooxygenase subunit A
MSAMEPSGLTALPEDLALRALFSRGGYRARMALRRVRPAEFFSNLGLADVLKQRAALLEERPQDFLDEPPNRADADALIRFAGSWTQVGHAQTFRQLGEVWEPDFVLLHRGKPIEVIGGCVCFPTGWSLTQKQHSPISSLHAPVPGLNFQLGSAVERFIGDLRPEECYQRMNWGLTSSSQMNQHPRDDIVEIASDCHAAETFVRVEWQALMAVDDLRAVFGIRIYHVTLESIRRVPEVARLLAENLKTMPEEMLRYKRLIRCRPRILELLRTA